MKHLNHASPFRQSQLGAVLIVALVMLLVMTIVGVSAIKGSNLQELMAGNVRDKQVSFQAAEAALRQAEDAVNDINPPDTSGMVPGFMAELDEGSVSSHWRNDYVWYEGANQFSVLTNVDLQITDENPRYVVEELEVKAVPGADGSAVDVLVDRPDPVVYRITSRGVGMTNGTVTYLQSMYRRQ